jgi:hypothetical protein
MGGAVSHLDQQPARLVDEKWQKIVRSDQVGINGKPEYPETGLEVGLPYRSVPIGRTAFQQFPAPDIIDEHVDVAVVFPNLLRQVFHLIRFEMIHRGCNTDAAKLRNELGSLFDSFDTVVVGSSAAAMPRPAPRVAPATTATRPRSACRFGEPTTA